MLAIEVYLIWYACILEYGIEMRDDCIVTWGQKLSENCQ
jgi:hypothetical protein